MARHPAGFGGRRRRALAEARSASSILFRWRKGEKKIPQYLQILQNEPKGENAFKSSTVTKPANCTPPSTARTNNSAMTTTMSRTQPALAKRSPGNDYIFPRCLRFAKFGDRSHFSHF